MAELSFENLLIVVAVAFAAPLVLGLFPRVRLPAVVLEIVAAAFIFAGPLTVLAFPALAVNLLRAPAGRTR